VAVEAVPRVLKSATVQVDPTQTQY